MYKIYFFITVSLLLTSCRKKDDNIEVVNSDYLVFGRYFNHCEGDCSLTYMLTNGKVFKTSKNNYSRIERSSFEELDEEKYKVVSNLFQIFPQQLFDRNQTSYGCPDCNRQGGLFIAYKKDGELRKWKIDRNKEQIPRFLHEFVDEVEKSIKILSR